MLSTIASLGDFSPETLGWRLVWADTLVGVPLLECDASHARRRALALAALIPLVLRRLGQAAGAGRTHEGVRARALRDLMAFFSSGRSLPVARCGVNGAPCRARRVGRAFARLCYSRPVRPDRRSGSSRRWPLPPRRERSEGCRGQLPSLPLAGVRRRYLASSVPG